MSHNFSDFFSVSLFFNNMYCEAQKYIHRMFFFPHSHAIYEEQSKRISVSENFHVGHGVVNLLHFHPQYDGFCHYSSYAITSRLMMMVVFFSGSKFMLKVYF